MPPVTVRDLRQKWPEIEERLSKEGSLLITRDGKVVARLESASAAPPDKKHFDPVAQQKWLSANYAGVKVGRVVDQAVAEQRKDRKMF